MPVTYIDRKTGKRCTESVVGDRMIRFAYRTLLGRSLWSLLFGNALPSKLLGLYYDSPLSKAAIQTLARTPGCEAGEAELPLDSYRCFNDFFTRKLKPGSRPYDPSPETLVSPADGRITVYPQLASDDPIPVKGAKRTLNELCGISLDRHLWAAAVIRLAPVDFHRYQFPCDCVQQQPPRRFTGKYHSVNPVALCRRPDLYVENTRQVTELESAVFGRFYFLEIGAFGVGSIVPTAGCGPHCKMTEKGCFKFGGSTVILLFDAGKVIFSSDLLMNSANAEETRLHCGETIGSLKNGR